MNASPVQPSSLSTRRMFLFGALLLAAFWYGLINQLRVEWTINPQYNYGWGVPLLGVYLLYKRWPSRPEPRQPSLRAGLLCLGAALIALILPVRIFQEANPDWRVVSWTYALVVVSLTLFALWLMGGRPWLRHFAFPVLFLLVAVPWPTPVEGVMVQSLMRAVASITVEGLNWCGFVARRQGNLIELPTGLVGINEACSGVRSFQSTLMIAIFFGELYRFTAARRLLLILCGIALAFGLNVGRAFFLTWLCASRGPSAIDAWHDPAGFAVFGLAFVALIGVTLWMHRARGDVPDPPTSRHPPNPVPAGILIAAGGWLLFTELATEAWYRFHERAATKRMDWAVRWPDQDPRFTFKPIPEEVRRILRFNEGQSAVWQPPEGGQWSLFLFHWKPGRAAAQLAKGHSPDICLPAAGLKLVERRDPETMNINGVTLPFESFIFESRGQRLFVFFCLWEERPLPESALPELEDWSVASRLQAVAHGRRHLGQKVLQVAIVGPQTPEQARKNLEAHLRQMIRLSHEPA